MKFDSPEAFLDAVARRDPHQPEFLQAVREVVDSLWPFIQDNPQYADYALLASLLLCLRADHASMAVLVWVMSLAAAALLVAFTLAWRPHWLRWFWWGAGPVKR